jgi:hypothetical protein
VEARISAGGDAVSERFGAARLAEGFAPADADIVIAW